LARLLALLVVEAEPEIATVARPIRARGGKVYVDFGQNGHGRTIVGPFSVRALPGAPVSCPLQWRELNPRLAPDLFTIRTVPRRFERLSDPLLPVLSGSIDMSAAMTRLEKILEGKATADRS
jgi:bifunctional non-homologous end joining protein LigD